MDANLRARLAELEQRFAQLQEDNDAAVGDDDDDLCEEVGASRDALLHDILLVAEQHGHSQELSSAVGSLLDCVIDYVTNRDGFDDRAPVASEELDSFSSKPVIKASGSKFSFMSMDTQAFMLSVFNEFPPSGGGKCGQLGRRLESADCSCLLSRSWQGHQGQGRHERFAQLDAQDEPFPLHLQALPLHRTLLRNDRSPPPHRCALPVRHGPVPPVRSRSTLHRQLSACL